MATMNLLVKNILSVLLLFALPFQSIAQPTKTIKQLNLSIDDGLSHGYISAVLQDKSGYL
jgi:hypothetical protein